MRRIVGLLLLLGAATSPAGEVAATPENSPVQARQRGLMAEEGGNCWVAAGAYYHLDPWLLYAVAWVESKLDPAAIHFNASSYDLGLMQINSSWLKTLGQYGITAAHLQNSCVSIYVGAWILAHNFHRMGFTWQAIGAYNARDPYKRLVYANKVYAAYTRLKGLASVRKQG